MLKKILHAGLVTAILVLLSFSASAAPSITSPDDCLIVIKSDSVDNPYLTYNEQHCRVYQYNFSGDYSPVIINDKYTIVVVREPAVSVKSISSGTNFNWRGPANDNKFGAVLPYKPGYLMIADFVFVTKAVKSGRNIMTSYFSRKITDAEREELLEHFRNDSAFVQWKK
jgi:hypothetical protein